MSPLDKVGIGVEELLVFANAHPNLVASLFDARRHGCGEEEMVAAITSVADAKERSAPGDFSEQAERAKEARLARGKGP